MKTFLSILKAPLWGLLFIIFLPTVGIAVVLVALSKLLFGAMGKLFRW